MSTLEIIKLRDATFNSVRIEPKTQHRAWMDDTSRRYAYRCLPLVHANQHGWAVYPQSTITAEWNGGDEVEDVKVQGSVASPNFGFGIVTFHLPFLIKTSPNYNLYVTGAPNHFVDGAQALTGVFESDWAPYSFTMNWKLTDPHRQVTWTPKDPLMFMFPVLRGQVEEFKTKISSIEDQPQEYQDQFHTFSKSRKEFSQMLKDSVENSVELSISESWQKNYYRGQFPDGSSGPDYHQTKLRVCPFESSDPQE